MLSSNLCLGRKSQVSGQAPRGWVPVDQMKEERDQRGKHVFKLSMLILFFSFQKQFPNSSSLKNSLPGRILSPLSGRLELVSSIEDSRTVVTQR